MAGSSSWRRPQRRARTGRRLPHHAVNFCQQSLLQSLLGDSLPRPPFLEQREPATRVALRGGLEGSDAIGPEAPIVAAQLAPRHDDARAIEEGERERPDRAPGGVSLVIGIGDLELALGPDGRANGGELRIACCNRRAWADQQV